MRGGAYFRYLITVTVRDFWSFLLMLRSTDLLLVNLVSYPLVITGLQNFMYPSLALAIMNPYLQ